jgi:outer membrane scaffolding protein for murein synthesis (MipA/OmpV family)
LLLPFLFAAPAYAQDAGTPPPAPAPAIVQDPALTDPPRPPIDPAKLDGNSLTLAVAAAYTPSYEGSNNYVLAPVPLVRGRVSRINFTLRGNRFSADLVPTSGGPGWDFQLGPVINLNFNRTRQIVDPRVKKLPHRKTAIELGGYAGIARQGVITSDYDRLGVSVATVYDINGSHGSYVITPSIDYSTPLSTKALVGISASANYMGEGYADTYFSIDGAGAAASGLPTFNAGKGWKDWTISALGAVSLTGDLTGGLSLVGGVNYRRLLNDAAASPVTRIAGSRDQWTGLLGLAYTF